MILGNDGRYDFPFQQRRRKKNHRLFLGQPGVETTTKWSTW